MSESTHRPAVNMAYQPEDLRPSAEFREVQETAPILKVNYIRVYSSVYL
jgi:hypothetical protein